MSYVRHYRLTFYDFLSTISNLSYFKECVFKIILFAVLQVLLDNLPFSHHDVISSWIKYKQNIYRPYHIDFGGFFNVFHPLWSESRCPKPHHDLRNLDAFDLSEGDKNVTSLLSHKMHIYTPLLRYEWLTSYLELFQSRIINLLWYIILKEKYNTTCSWGAKLIVFSIYENLVFVESSD